jgi:hypothetical protein
MDSTREALRALVIHTLNDPQTLATVSVLSKRVLSALLEDPKTLRQLLDVLNSLTLDPRAKESLLRLLEQLMRDETTRRNLTQLLAFTFMQEPVKKSVTRSLGDSVHDLLSRGDVQAHAKEFVGNVVRDHTVQAQSGDAIWSSVMYAITPSWLAWIWQPPESAAVASTEAEVIVADTVAAVEKQQQEQEQRQQQQQHEQSADAASEQTKSAGASATVAGRLARAKTRPIPKPKHSEQTEQSEEKPMRRRTLGISRKRVTGDSKNEEAASSTSSDKNVSKTCRLRGESLPSRWTTASITGAGRTTDLYDGERQ